MSLFGFSLVLAAAFCHATWNYYVKRINGGPELVWLFSFVSTLLYLPFALFIIISEKPQIGIKELAFVAGSSILHLGYFLLLQKGYRVGNLSLIYPTARATGPFLSTFLAVTFLGEQLSLQILVGALIIIFGVLRLTSQKGSTGNSQLVSLFFGIAAGFLIGSYTAWDAYAVSVLLIPPLLLDYASSIGRSLLLAPVALRRRDLVLHHWKQHRVGVLIIAFFNPLAYILVLYALTFTPVIYVAPIREISVLLTVLMGSILLKEGDLKRRLFWSIIILAGVTLLATS